MITRRRAQEQWKLKLLESKNPAEIVLGMIDEDRFQPFPRIVEVFEDPSRALDALKEAEKLVEKRHLEWLKKLQKEFSESYGRSTE